MVALYYTPGPKDKDTASLVRRKDGKTRTIARAKTVGAIFRQLFSVYGPELRGHDAGDFWGRIDVKPEVVKYPTPLYGKLGPYAR